jgi:hypothetical protein
MHYKMFVARLGTMIEVLTGFIRPTQESTFVGPGHHSAPHLTGGTGGTGGIMSVPLGSFWFCPTALAVVMCLEFLPMCPTHMQNVFSSLCLMLTTLISGFYPFGPFPPFV